ncbi:hypothetical protein CYMTET_23112 [Cymbomonas tetramitiformis]|uniref:Uncharacterized protein n=1 Tax=Cymbomonas tetramitiformis TaxID=36881 RepID=A0AAE0FYK9_9CHLO|nr:hypothetical protein CYMTET_23112 [Cymbomonas tetramitiformis]
MLRPRHPLRKWQRHRCLGWDQAKRKGPFYFYAAEVLVMLHSLRVDMQPSTGSASASNKYSVTATGMDPVEHNEGSEAAKGDMGILRLAARGGPAIFIVAGILLAHEQCQKPESMPIDDPPVEAPKIVPAPNAEASMVKRTNNVHTAKQLEFMDAQRALRHQAGRQAGSTVHAVLATRARHAVSEEVVRVRRPTESPTAVQRDLLHTFRLSSMPAAESKFYQHDYSLQMPPMLEMHAPARTELADVIIEHKEEPEMNLHQSCLFFAAKSIAAAKAALRSAIQACSMTASGLQERQLTASTPSWERQRARAAANRAWRDRSANMTPRPKQDSSIDASTHLDSHSPEKTPRTRRPIVQSWLSSLATGSSTVRSSITLQAMDSDSKQDMAEFQEDFEGSVEDMEDQTNPFPPPPSADTLITVSLQTWLVKCESAV